MNASEFINKCDLEGGLSALFDYGITPYQIENTAPLDFRSNLYNAYRAWQHFKAYEDTFYKMCEECKHEA